MYMKASECRNYDNVIRFCKEQIKKSGDRTGKWKKLADSLGDYVVTDIDSRSDKDMAMDDFIMADNCVIGINGVRFINRNEDKCERIKAMRDTGAWAFPSVPKATKKKYTVYAGQDIITGRVWLFIEKRPKHTDNPTAWFPGLRFQTIVQI